MLDFSIRHDIDLSLNATQWRIPVYGKLFDQMYDGTLATKGPWQALVTFQQFIILADQHGVVDMTAEAISRRTTIPLEIIQQGIEALEQPDTESRSPELDGRRITRLSENRNWGWQVTNYEHYRNLRSQEDRRAYHRAYWHTRKGRAAAQQNSTHSTDSTHAVSISSKHKHIQKQKQEVPKSKTTAPPTPQRGAELAPVPEMPDCIPVQEWTDYVQHRKEIKKPLTTTGAKQALQRLQKWHSEGHDIAAILGASVANGWQGLFLSKKDDRLQGRKATPESFKKLIVGEQTEKDITDESERLG